MNKSNAWKQGALVNAATAVLLLAEVSIEEICESPHQRANQLVFAEFERQLSNLMRDNADDYTAITFDSLVRNEPIPEVMLIHLARLVIFMGEGYMPGIKS